MQHIFILKNTEEYQNIETIIYDVMHDLDYVIYHTNHKEEVTYILEGLKQPSRIYAIGGDGTAHLYVQSLVHTDHELVVIPLGTGNDFIRMFSDERDFKTLLMNSLRSSSQPIDTVKINHLYSLNTACFSLDAVVANHVHDELMIPFIPKKYSYIISIIKNIFQYQNHVIKMKVNDQIIYSNKTILCTINNGQYYGGGFRVTPDADVTDGYFNVCVVDSMSFFKIPYYLYWLVKANIKHLKKVHCFKQQHLEIDYKGSINIDGEEYQDDYFIFDIAPQSLNLVMYKEVS